MFLARDILLFVKCHHVFLATHTSPRVKYTTDKIIYSQHVSKIMLANINMDIAAFKKNIDLKSENRRMKQEIRKKIQDYKDAKQGLAIQREEQFKPIVDEVKQVKETIDEKPLQNRAH